MNIFSKTRRLLRLIVVLIPVSVLCSFDGLAQKDGRFQSHQPDVGLEKARSGEIPGVNPVPKENRKVFIIVIDGIRDSEGFEDPTHQYIPHLWNDLKPMGTLFTNFLIHSITLTTAVHATFTSGTIQDLPLYGLPIKAVQTEPSIFQYYRSQLGFSKTKTCIINGKGCIVKVGESLNPFFSIDAFEPYVAFDGVNGPQGPDDAMVHDRTLSIIDEYHPSLVMINFKDVDQKGHTGVWGDYTSAIQTVDSLVYSICQKILQDPFYQDETTIFITTDHGRHLDGIANGFVGHGDSCLGCRNIFLLVIGPNVKKDAVVEKQCYNMDIAPTVAALLGFQADFHSGRILHEMFETPIGAEIPLYRNPSIACEEDKLYLVFSRREDADSEIFYQSSEDNGATWTSAVSLSPPSFHCTPGIVASGTHVAAIWKSYQPSGTWTIDMRESSDRGLTWSNEISFNITSTVIDYAACYSQGSLNLILCENGETTAFHIMVIQDGNVIKTETLSLNSMAGALRCAPAADGVHVVFQMLTMQDITTDIFYCRFDGNQWLSTKNISETPAWSLQPDIAVDDKGIHAVWVEDFDGTFKVVVRNSDDGINWTSTQVIEEPVLGGWHPNIASGDLRLTVVWEDYKHTGLSLHTAMSRNGGASWSSLEMGAIDGMLPVSIIDGLNRFHLSWVQYNEPSEIKYKNILLYEGARPPQDSSTWAASGLPITAAVVVKSIICATQNEELKS